MSVACLWFRCLPSAEWIIGLEVASRILSIAQLVERRTVECVKTSLGRWFESGVLADLDPPRIGPPGPYPLADLDPLTKLSKNITIHNFLT